MRFVAILALLLTFGPALAGVEVRQFDDPQTEQRYKHLINELRCLVCQNQNLADSNAELAQDLREQVYAMLEGGASDKEIIDFMVNRYGDFVLYRPPVKSSTLLLWAGPFVFLIGGLVILLLVIRRQRKQTPQLSDAQHTKAQQLLKGEGDSTS